MSQVHMYVGISVVSLNAVAGVWGGVAWLRSEPSVAFWYWLRAAQVTVVVQAGLGVALIASGSRPGDDLHLVYGLLPLLVTVVTEAMRASAVVRETAGVAENPEQLEALSHADQVALARQVVRRETGIMATGALVILGLALRAFFVAT